MNQSLNTSKPVHPLTGVKAPSPCALWARRFTVQSSWVHSQEPLLFKHMAGGGRESKCRVYGSSEEVLSATQQEMTPSRQALHTEIYQCCLDMELACGLVTLLLGLPLNCHPVTTWGLACLLFWLTHWGECSNLLFCCPWNVNILNSSSDFCGNSSHCFSLFSFGNSFPFRAKNLNDCKGFKMPY